MSVIFLNTLAIRDAICLPPHTESIFNMGYFEFCFLKLWYPSSSIYFNMEHLSSTHTTNQHPSYDRYVRNDALCQPYHHQIQIQIFHIKYRLCMGIFVDFIQTTARIYMRYKLWRRLSDYWQEDPGPEIGNVTTWQSTKFRKYQSKLEQRLVVGVWDLSNRQHAWLICCHPLQVTTVWALTWGGVSKGAFHKNNELFIVRKITR